MPIDISTAATTRSMIRKGRAIRNPISNARWISDSMKDGISTDRRSAGPVPGAISARLAKVSGSVRAAMNPSNGTMPRWKASAMPI